MVQFQVWKANRLISRATCNVERDLLVLRLGRTVIVVTHKCVGILYDRVERDRM